MDQETIKEKVDIVEFNLNECIDLCSDNSDPDDNYYLNDDLKEKCKKFTSQVSLPLLASIEFCDTTSASNTDRNTPCTVVDIEILEENNNDPNNNLDSMQRLREQGNSISVPSDDRCKKKGIRRLSRPKPGCSKDFNDTTDVYEKESAEYLSSSVLNPSKDFDDECVSISASDSSKDYNHANNKYKLPVSEETIRKETEQICNLLPKFEYETVYAALYKNWSAENRIELCLWDLLPHKRPTAKIPCKRKFVDDSPKKCRNAFKIPLSKDRTFQNNIPESSKDIKQKEDTIDCTKQPNTSPGAIINLCDEDMTVNDNNLSNGMLKSTPNGIIHPAKLKINRDLLYIDHTTSSNYSILTPSKLTYITAPQHSNQTNRKVPSVRKLNDKEFINNKSMPLGRNVFLSNSTNLPMNNILHKYMEYLQREQNAKREQLFGRFGDFNTKTRNKARESFPHWQFTNQTKNIPVNRKKVSRKMNYVNVNHGTNMTCNSNDKKSHVTNSRNLFLHGTLSNVTKINLQNPSENALSRRIYAALCAGIRNVLTVAASIEHLSKSTSVSVASESPNVTIPPTSTEMPVTVDSTILGEPSTSAIVHSAAGTTQVGGARRKEIDRKEDIVLPYEYQEIYEQLVVIFPRIEENYLKKMCLEVSKANDASAGLLQELVECVLQNINSCPTKRVARKKNYNNDEQYTYLSGIFPNADSAYLKKVIARMEGNENEINKFIQSQCEHPTYPTKDEKLIRTKTTEQQMQYTSKFNVKQFLEIFPNPFKHFEDPNRQCKFSADALSFLKFHFANLEEHVLLAYYETCKYNLTSTVAVLEDVASTRITEQIKYSWHRNALGDIPLLQECAFITHKAEILEYMSKLKEEEAQELEKLKKNNELLECQCCYDNECMPSKCSTCNDGHIFCNSCIVKGTELKMANGETRISCFVTCDEEFNLSTLQKVLPPTQFSILIGKKQEAEVMAAGLEGLVSCPFCHFASIPPPEDKVFKCLNPECMKESCRSCKMLNHVPLKCYEKETDKARLLLEEKMTEALVRKCYKCGLPFFKEDGCNKISCRCGAMMCYICDQPVRSYAHFNEGQYQNSDLCPLWSDNRQINTAVVEEVAKKTVEHIKEKDPNVKLDAPGVSSNNRAFNATTLSGRVNKITKFDT